MKNTLLLFFAIIVVSTAYAQEAEISREELKELRRNPDTSNTVYLEKVAESDVDDSTIDISRSRSTMGKTYEDPDNPGVFITDIDEPIKKQAKAKGVQFGHPKLEPISDDENSISISANAPLYSGINLDQHAMRIAANCEASNTSGTSGAAVVNLDDSFYVIPTKRAGLPPKPGAEGDRGVMGVDVNKNCVRDDVEHFIFELYGEKNESELRKHLYAYAIWLRFYLIDGISQKSIQAVARQNLKTGLCLNKVLGNSRSDRVQTEIFALMHNTVERTEAYFVNEKILTGFDVDVSAPPGC